MRPHPRQSHSLEEALVKRIAELFADEPVAIDFSVDPVVGEAWEAGRLAGS
jgi:hypothetical protein